MKPLTKLSPEELQTIKYYDDNAQLWSEKHGLNNNIELMFQPEMDKLFKPIPKGKILEVGTGHGGDAIQLISHYGLKNYIGCDASRGLLKIAKSRNPGASIKFLSIYDLNFNNSFDSFWASAILIHIPKKRLAQALGKLHQSLKKGGIGFISIMEGSADMEESRPGRYYSLWQQPEFEKELSKVGFTVINKRKMENVQPVSSPWLGYLVKST